MIKYILFKQPVTRQQLYSAVNNLHAGGSSINGAFDDSAIAKLVLKSTGYEFGWWFIWDYIPTTYYLYDNSSIPKIWM